MTTKDQLILAIKSGSLEQVKQLLKEGVDICSPNDFFLEQTY